MLEKYWRTIRISRTRDPDSEYRGFYYRVDYQEELFSKPVIIKLDTEDTLLRLLAETPHKKRKWSGLPSADWLSLEGKLKKILGTQSKL